MIKNAFFIEFLRKYRGKYSEKQQKFGKNCFFIEKKWLYARKPASKRIFLVILQPKSVTREPTRCKAPVSHHQEKEKCFVTYPL